MHRLHSFKALGWLAVVILLAAGCANEVAEDFGTVAEPLDFESCLSDRECLDDEVCRETLDRETGRRVGYCHAEAACETSRECREGTVCRGEEEEMLCRVIDREPREDRTDDDEAECPRGSVPGRVVCAPGFDAVVVWREPLCTTCEADAATVRRCRAAGLSPERCRWVLGGGGDPTSAYERCRAAGLTPERCRYILREETPEPMTRWERCRAAGYSPERCRALLADDDTPTLWERCRAAGLSPERCRSIVTGEEDADFLERCRAAGLSPERCRDLLADRDR